MVERLIKPKSKRAKRALKEIEPKIIENTKTLLILKSHTANLAINQFFQDIITTKRPFVKSLLKKNKIFPFEDKTPIEFLCTKNDCSLFLFGSHSKKKPQNLVFGRIFDSSVIDMFEFGLENFKRMAEFKKRTKRIEHGTKPFLCFLGKSFEEMDKLKKIKNLFVDFFRGKETDFVDLKYIKRAIVFAAIDFETIRFTDYAVTIKQDNNVSLEEIGPSFELKLKRNYIASEKLLSTSLKKPKKMVNEPKKVKNVKTDNFGSKIGKVHVDKQDIRKINKRKFKGYKKNRKD